MVERFEQENEKMGKRLQDYRVSLKITQKEVAAACGLSKNYISAVERGAHKVTLQTLIGYCRILNRTPNELLGMGEEEIIPELVNILKEMDTKEQEIILEIIKNVTRFSG